MSGPTSSHEENPDFAVVGAPHGEGVLGGVRQLQRRGVYAVPKVQSAPVKFDINMNNMRRLKHIVLVQSAMLNSIHTLGIY